MKQQLLRPVFVILLSLCLIACQTSFNKQLEAKPEGYVKSSDGVPIYYTKSGATGNSTLLFIHCWGCNGSYWEPQIEYFAKTHRVVTLDLAGHGLSSGDRDNFTIEKFANDVVTVVRKLGLTHVILIGHSLGGATAIEAALKLPDHVLGIIAVDSFETDYQWPDTSEIAAVMVPFRKNFYKTTYPMIKSRFTPHTDKALIYSIAKDIALAPPDIGISSLENFYQWMASDYINTRGKLTVPLLHINPQKNKAAANNSEKIFYVKFVGHYIPQEAPKKFNQALEQVIEIIVMKNSTSMN